MRRYRATLHVGNYTLSNLLGRGGTSEVYAAEHRFLGDAVAIKLLRPAYADDQRVRDAFLEEAARTREIRHPNVVHVIDFGHDATSGSCYLVMERIEGESLGARLHRTGRLGEPALRTLAAAIADGMQAAHDRSIVHRDLKPGNVMLRGDAPTIVDFGIAKSLGATSAVVTERRIGTLAYMAPEQLAEGLITPAVDIWALGVIMYEAATGQLPFDNFNDGRLPQLFDAPGRPATLVPISAALDDLIMRCLERSPGRRPASMAEIARALRSSSDERITLDAGPRAALSPPAMPAARRRRLWLAIAGGALGAAAIGVLMWPAPESPPAPAVTPGPPPTVVLPSIDAGMVPVSEPPAVSKPATKPPPSRVHVRAKQPRTTSQGETLD